MKKMSLTEYKIRKGLVSIIEEVEDTCAVIKSLTWKQAIICLFIIMLEMWFIFYFLTYEYVPVQKPF